jgi:hypothetical protein
MATLSATATGLFGALCLALAAGPASAQAPWHLVTQEEEARDVAALHVAAQRDLLGPPTIDLVRPDISRPIRNPATIEIRFRPSPGGAIDMRTFNATYGWLGINITRRLLEHAVTTVNGLAVANVDLPPGDHRVTLSIADTTGRSTSRTFNLLVSR